MYWYGICAECILYIKIYLIFVSVSVFFTTYLYGRRGTIVSILCKTYLLVAIFILLFFCAEKLNKTNSASRGQRGEPGARLKYTKEA